MNEQKNLHCYTIGHSNHPIEDFIQTLKKFQIQCIIDVRTIPVSTYMPHFNRENLETWLEREGIEYKYLGNMIGGRYTDPALLDSQGSVDYEKVEQRSIFQAGIDQVCQIIDAGKLAALMCSEKDPLDCHRFILVSKALAKKGVSIDHIVFEGTKDAKGKLIGTLISTSDLEKNYGKCTNRIMRWITKCYTGEEIKKWRLTSMEKPLKQTLWLIVNWIPSFHSSE
jgi:uncharacterized protein (DUF488 family)